MLKSSKKINMEKKVPKKIKLDMDQAFDQYQLSTSYKLIRAFALIIGLFNLGLIIPDFFNIADPSSKLLMIIYRSVFLLSVVLILIFMKKIKTFKILAYVITIYELAAVIIFFHIFYMYKPPDFMIQLLGLFTIIIAIFLIPNIWRNTLILSIIIAAGFVLSSYIVLSINWIQIILAIVYTGVEIALCAIFSFYFYQYKRGEFAARADLQKTHSTDPLTKVGNRIMLKDEAEKWVKHCERNNLQLSLVLVDVDNLKKVNDEFGHMTGDTILFELAQLMNKRLRKNDVCVRWGGDEFILLLPDTSIENAKIITGRVRASIIEHKFNNGVSITCSFGIADMKKGYSLEQLIEQADALMYSEKEQGKGSVGLISEVENI